MYLFRVLNQANSFEIDVLILQNINYWSSESFTLSYFPSI